MNAHRLFASACIALLAFAAHAADPPQKSAVESAQEGLKLLDKRSGTDNDWQHFMLDDAATHVSAASMAGIAPSAVTIAESTRDFGLLVQAVDPKNKGGGVAITPARASHPFPRVNVKNYLDNPLAWQPLVNLTLSYAQGVSEVDSIQYRRRAVAVSTNGTFRAMDDPVWVRVKAMACADPVITKAVAAFAASAASGPIVPDSNASSPVSVKIPDVTTELERCSTELQTKFDARWFRPIWSLTLATGDVSLDETGASTVSQGESVVVAARYGAPISRSGSASTATDADKADFEWGWAVSGSAKFNHREPVLSTVGTSALQRQNSTVLALRLAAGTDTARLLAEASNVKVRAAQGGEQTLKRALGVDYRIAAGSWLNFRFGRREKASGAGDESAGLLTLTISPSALLKPN